MKLTRRGRAVGATLILAVLGTVGWVTGKHLSGGENEAADRVAAAYPASTVRPTPTTKATPVSLSAPLSAPQQRQVQYALKYWKNYNTAVYGDDNPNGGDCANFVSQTLLQRGWKMNASWFNHGQNAMSSAWAFVPSMYNYFEANASQLGLVQLGENDRSKYAVGDVVMFWWKNSSGGYSASPDHVQVIDSVMTTGGKTTVKMASHNEDYEYRDLDQEITQQHPGAKFVVWHLTRDTN